MNSPTTLSAEGSTPEKVDTVTRRLATPSRSLLGAAVAAFMLFSALVAVPTSAAEPLPDGRYQHTAAGSCWEIKQNDPGAQSGSYWLWTPEMIAPEQFHCDQDTDGGGWVLIGRGRENWSTSDEGMGDIASVRQEITGPAAFAPRQLSLIHI